MRKTAIRVSVDPSLASLPVIHDLIQNPAPGFDVSVSVGAESAERDADVLLLCADAGGTARRNYTPTMSFPHHAKVVLIGSDIGGSYREEAILRGAAGVLGTSTSAATLIKALTCVVRGELWLDRQTTGRIFAKLARQIAKNRDRGGSGPLR